MTVRTRMAPSPTGEYHIGGMRTLLYNYAFAKKNEGNFILRIEDTDKNREVEGALERLQIVIKDYGLTWDEGPGVGGTYAPYLQSQRLDIYHKHTQQLLDSKHAYYCFCSPERLEELRETQQSQNKPTRYDKKCLSLTEAEIQKKLAANVPYVVRLNVKENIDITWEDLILGTVTINTNEIDDQILLKTDKFPTYHLAVVVDDYLMNISHVLRGNEWIPSTPKQLLLFQAFGWEPPLFGHLPNLKEKDANKKMSKRYGDVHAHAFLEKGYLPEALLNFIMFLGWNPGTERELYSLDEFIQDFSLEHVTKSDLVAFDRDKLLWFNGVYIRNLADAELYTRLQEWASKFGIALQVGDSTIFSSDYVIQVIGLLKERLKLLSEFNDLSGYFFVDPSVDRDLLTSFGGDKTTQILRDFVELFEQVSDWHIENLDAQCHKLLEEKNYKPKEAFMTLRVAISGVKATPPIFDTIALLGKEVVLRRLKALN